MSSIAKCAFCSLERLVEKAAKETSALVGHKNLSQRIRYVEKLKKRNYELEVVCILGLALN